MLPSAIKRNSTGDVTRVLDGRAGAWSIVRCAGDAERARRSESPTMSTVSAPARQRSTCACSIDRERGMLASRPALNGDNQDADGHVAASRTGGLGQPGYPGHIDVALEVGHTRSNEEPRAIGQRVAADVAGRTRVHSRHAFREGETCHMRAAARSARPSMPGGRAPHFSSTSAVAGPEGQVEGDRLPGARGADAVGVAGRLKRRRARSIVTGGLALRESRSGSGTQVTSILGVAPDSHRQYANSLSFFCVPGRGKSHKARPSPSRRDWSVFAGNAARRLRTTDPVLRFSSAYSVATGCSP